MSAKDTATVAAAAGGSMLLVLVQPSNCASLVTEPSGARAAADLAQPKSPTAGAAAPLARENVAHASSAQHASRAARSDAKLPQLRFASAPPSG